MSSFYMPDVNHQKKPGGKHPEQEDYRFAMHLYFIFITLLFHHSSISSLCYISSLFTLVFGGILQGILGRIDPDDQVVVFVGKVE